MSEFQFVLGHLRSIEQKHHDYFVQAKLHIMDCVSIKGEKTLSVHVINPDIPFDIRQEIEALFWVE